MLLEAGADPNLSLPLTLACRFGSISLVQLLLEHGARPQPEALEAARARLGQPLPEGTDGLVKLRRVRNSRGEAEVHYSWSNRSLLSVQGEGHYAIVALLEAFSGGSQ